ncbi:MAG TPA: M23 family peptidase, partial [Novosphingobium sp.]|nr:M23 family peptidase [Novosphingobium sp.]
MSIARRAAPLLAALAVTAACNDSTADAAAPAGVAANAAVPAAVAPRGDDFELAGELTQGGWIRGRVPAGTRSASFDGAPLTLAADGFFIAAFDRDAGTEAKLEAVLDNGRSVTRTLAVTPRAWRIEHVAVGPRPGALPSEEFRIRRAAELQRINA